MGTSTALMSQVQTEGMILTGLMISLRTTGICLLLVLISVSYDMASAQIRDASSAVETNDMISAEIRDAFRSVVTNDMTSAQIQDAFRTVTANDITADQTRDAYRKVKANLLSHPYAVDKIPPKVLPGESIDIAVGFMPNKILSVNEAEMTVTIATGTSMAWREPAFAWNPENESISWVSVSVHDVWVPTIVNTLAIDADDMIMEPPPLIRIHFTGSIQVVQLATMTVSCSFDMEWFPFDEQRCLFPIVPFNVDSATVNTVSVQDRQRSQGDRDVSTDDWTWEEVTPTQHRTKTQSNVDEPRDFTFVCFEVLMRRRGEIFYKTNVIFPIFASAVLTVLVFLIPPAAGEKLSFLVAIFISTTVFLSSLSSTMSKGQGNICRFNIFILAVTAQNILATAASMFVLHRYTKEQEEKEAKEMLSEPTETTGSDSLNHSHVPTSQLSDQHTEQNLNIGFRIKKLISNYKSGPPSQTKVDAFERVVVSRSSHSKEPNTNITTAQVERNVTGIRRCWTRGCRLSSRELDRMFFVIFAVVSCIVLSCIMHLP